MHAYIEFGWLRGFVVPSWGARIEQAWWDHDPLRFRQWVTLVQGVHGNCPRLWIEFTAWMADLERMAAGFTDAIVAIGEHGMKTMPRYFNRWHDWSYAAEVPTSRICTAIGVPSSTMSAPW